MAVHNEKAPFDSSKGLKDYAGKTIIGSKSSATGRSDSVIAGEHAKKCAELHVRNCTGLQVQVYPSFQGSWPEAAPETIEKMTFQTEGLSALVNWGRNHHQETLQHLMIGPNQYFPEWFWKNNYTAGELDQLLKRYIATLMTANDNRRKMDAWNVFNEMLEAEYGKGYKKDGAGRGNCALRASSNSSTRHTQLTLQVFQGIGAFLAHAVSPIGAVGGLGVVWVFEIGEHGKA